MRSPFQLALGPYKLLFSRIALQNLPSDLPSKEDPHGLNAELGSLVDAVVNALVCVNQTRNLDDALKIRDDLQRLPNYFVAEVLNSVMLRLVNIDPELCRWFILDVYLYGADPEGKADVAERLNLLMADLQASSGEDTN